MPVLTRKLGPRGPRFYIDGEHLMFVNVLDASTYEPPRLATTADAEAHPKALADFEAGLEPEQKPLVTFLTPDDAEIPPPAKAKGEKAPV